MQGRFVWPLVLSLGFLSACGGSGTDSPNDVSQPSIDERFAVDTDGRQLALLCYGEGSPTVFLEPGDGGSGDEFSFVMRLLGGRTTTCTYDRTGFGRSDPPSKTRRTLDDAVADLHALDAVADLHALIEAADIPVPFVHVGASGGGYIALYYASRYSDDVAGVVLLDVARDDPREGAKLFPGAKAWGNPEHLDNVDAARRMTRLPPLALEDIPLRVITAAEGPSIAPPEPVGVAEAVVRHLPDDPSRWPRPRGGEHGTVSLTRSRSFLTRSKTRTSRSRVNRAKSSCSLHSFALSVSGCHSPLPR